MGKLTKQYKRFRSLNIFKQWIPDNFPCKIRKNLKIKQKKSKKIIKEYFLFILIVAQYIFYFLSKVYYDHHLRGIN